MSSLEAPQIRSIARGETNTIVVDWGENTAGAETGVLKDGDTIDSCVVSVYSKPTGADDLMLDTVEANDSVEYVDGRSCSIGEATLCNIESADDQTAGLYRLKFTATTTNGKVLPRYVRVMVEVL